MPLPARSPRAARADVVGGRFRVGRAIGEGAMGTVYEAEQLSLGRMVAVKLLRDELLGDETSRRRFEQEARNAAALDHPNSIQVIELGHDGDVPFIAMELLAGVDLAEVIETDGAVPIGRAFRIVDQILAVLDQAHAQGIVHRDLKPSNVMLVSRGGEPDFVKVCDYGIAKAPLWRGDAALTVDGTVCGTPEYMSPEQAQGEDADGRADLYAASVILYQLITGELPFLAASPVELMAKHVGEPPQPPSVRRPDLAVPPALEALILGGLEKDPRHRPPSAAAFRAELRLACGIAPPAAPARRPTIASRSRPATAAARVRPPASRSWWQAGASAVTAALRRRPRPSP